MSIKLIMNKNIFLDKYFILLSEFCFHTLFSFHLGYKEMKIFHDLKYNEFMRISTGKEYLKTATFYDILLPISFNY